MCNFRFLSKIWRQLIVRDSCIDGAFLDWQIEDISKRPYDILFVDNPSVELQLVAVRNCASAVFLISNPVSRAFLEAVWLCGDDDLYDLSLDELVA